MARGSRRGGISRTSRDKFLKSEKISSLSERPRLSSRGNPQNLKTGRQTNKTGLPRETGEKGGLLRVREMQNF